MSARFRTTSLDAIDEIPIDAGDGATLRWKPLRRTLGIRAFGTNAYAADAGEMVVEPHDEVSSSGSGGHEEIYVVVRGAATFTIDGEELDAPAGTVVFLPEPEAQRAATAREDGTLVLAVGGEPGTAYAVSPWEHYFAAQGPASRGDWAEAAEVVAGALPEHEGNPRVHYELARHLVRDGRHDEALVQLRHAHDADPAHVAGWARDDADLLAPLRERDGYPPLGA